MDDPKQAYTKDFLDIPLSQSLMETLVAPKNLAHVSIHLENLLFKNSCHFLIFEFSRNQIVFVKIEVNPRKIPTSSFQARFLMLLSHEISPFPIRQKIHFNYKKKNIKKP